MSPNSVTAKALLSKITKNIFTLMYLEEFKEAFVVLVMSMKLSAQSNNLRLTSGVYRWAKQYGTK